MRAHYLLILIDHHRELFPRAQKKMRNLKQEIYRSVYTPLQVTSNIT